MSDEHERLAEKKAALLSAMANPNRLKILLALSRGETSVGNLEQYVELSQSALSQHLAKLRHDKLVSTRRSAQTIYYATRDPRVLKMLSVLDEIFVQNQRAGRHAQSSAK
ncbi:DNA-binding transcriptional ArsR family regulator [Rhizobium sp. BE258]|nr:metalloregulator ArsR/SmtB family transcription factor [Rhizobium sp. BE258]MDR7145299.1 DNA-binding transcriptional ArsR family regulator [Rhizobium sp. BE258]